MAIPEGMNLFTYFNQGVGDLSSVNSEFYVFEKYWSYWTPQQKTLMKQKLVQDIEAALVIINDVKQIINDVQV